MNDQTNAPVTQGLGGAPADGQKLGGGIGAGATSSQPLGGAPAGGAGGGMVESEVTSQHGSSQYDNIRAQITSLQAQANIEPDRYERGRLEAAVSALEWALDPTKATPLALLATQAA